MSIPFESGLTLSPPLTVRCYGSDSGPIPSLGLKGCTILFRILATTTKRSLLGNERDHMEENNHPSQSYPKPYSSSWPSITKDQQSCSPNTYLSQTLEREHSPGQKNVLPNPKGLSSLACQYGGLHWSIFEYWTSLAILRINPTWLWCIILFTYCWIQFANISLKIFASVSWRLLFCYWLFVVDSRKSLSCLADSVFSPVKWSETTGQIILPGFF